MKEIGQGVRRRSIEEKGQKVCGGGMPWGGGVLSTLRGNARLQSETRSIGANHTPLQVRDFNGCL
jgi:hypothetical protein